MDGMDRVSGNAQAMRVAWSSLEAALETGRACSARALSKLLEIQENWVPAGAQNKDQPLGETMIKSLKIAVEMGGLLEAWLEALSATSEKTVTLVARPNREVPDRALLWQEIEEGVPLLNQMTASLEQAGCGITWATSQWSEVEIYLRGKQTLGKCGEVISQLRTLTQRKRAAWKLGNSSGEG